MLVYRQKQMNPDPETIKQEIPAYMESKILAENESFIEQRKVYDDLKNKLDVVI